MVVLTAAAGFYLGSQGHFDLGQFIQTLVGTALVAAGSSALNQLREREVDARMDRTRGRPVRQHDRLPGGIVAGDDPARGSAHAAGI